MGPIRLIGRPVFTFLRASPPLGGPFARTSTGVGRFGENAGQIRRWRIASVQIRCLSLSLLLSFSFSVSRYSLLSAFPQGAHLYDDDAADRFR